MAEYPFGQAKTVEGEERCVVNPKSARYKNIRAARIFHTLVVRCQQNLDRIIGSDRKNNDNKNIIIIK